MRFKILFSSLCLIGTAAHAEYSFSQAKQDFLAHSETIEAAAAMHEASTLQSQSLANLGKPTVSINARALSFRQSSDISLYDAKQNIKNHLHTQASEHFGQLNALHLPADTTAALQQKNLHAIDNAINKLPDSTNVAVRDTVFSPSVSVMMPLYTGGLIENTQRIAQLGEERQSYAHQERRSLALLELIESYFGVQLKSQLLKSQQQHLEAMQLHANNARKLEQAGFISKGQRMQFEVAANQVQRLQQNAQLAYQQSLFTLKALLKDESIETLGTSLFINPSKSLSWDTLIQKLDTQAPLPKKLQADINLAQQQVAIHQSNKKPKVFAIGQYQPLDNDWFIGVSATYTLYGGIDHDKQAQAAKKQQQAARASSQKITQEIVNGMHHALLEFNTAKQTHTLLEENRLAALENLRIQKLAYQEGMGTVSGVVDAQASLQNIQSEIALNAYRYVMALAALLHATGSLDDFEQHIQESGVIKIN